MARPAEAICAALLLLGSASRAAGEEASASVVLRWKSVPAASTYQLEIARDASFRAVVLSARVPTAGYRWTEIPVTRHYWRVRSIDSLGRSGNWSPFKTIEPALAPPTLVAPLDKASMAQEISSPQSIELSCSPSGLAKSYALEVATDPDFRSVVTSVSGASPFFSVVLGPGEYYWRMRSTSLSGRETPLSKSRSFAVVPQLAAQVLALRSGKRAPTPLVKPRVATDGEARPVAPTAAASTPAEPPDDARVEPIGTDDPSETETNTETPSSSDATAGTPPPPEEPKKEGPYSVGVQAGWYSNFARASSPWAGVQGAWATGLLSNHLVLSARASYYSTNVTVPAMAGLQTPISASAHVFPVSVLALYEARLSDKAIYAGAGPSLLLARAISGHDVATGADLGLQAALGARLPLGPGSVFAESGLFLGTIDSPLAHLRASGLMVSVGYQFGR